MECVRLLRFYTSDPISLLHSARSSFALPDRTYLVSLSLQFYVHSILSLSRLNPSQRTYRMSPHHSYICNFVIPYSNHCIVLHSVVILPPKLRSLCHFSLISNALVLFTLATQENGSSDY